MEAKMEYEGKDMPSKATGQESDIEESLELEVKRSPSMDSLSSGINSLVTGNDSSTVLSNNVVQLCMTRVRIGIY